MVRSIPIPRSPVSGMLLPRTSTYKATATSPRRYQRIINLTLLLILTIKLLILISRLLFRPAHHETTTSSPYLDCNRRIKLHNAFSTLCRPATRGAVYSARFGGVGGWELEAFQSGEFGEAFHVFDPCPSIAEHQKGILYHPVGIGPSAGTLELGPPSRAEKTFILLSNSTAMGKVARDKVIKVEVKALMEVMSVLKHTRLAILRLDVGGLELAMIEQWGKEGRKLPVEQIVVRFDGDAMKMRAVTKKQVDQAVRWMTKLGYRRVDIAEGEINFVRIDMVSKGFWKRLDTEEGNDDDDDDDDSR